jgi:photosystem II stability/assembly factor-like uncharacterized protein
MVDPRSLDENGVVRSADRYIGKCNGLSVVLVRDSRPITKQVRKEIPMHRPKMRGPVLVKAPIVAMALALFSVHATIAADAWTKLNSGSTTRIFLSVWFTSADVGYVVGDSGTILKTIDAGQHWSALNSGTSLALFSVCFPTPDTGYISTNWGAGNILRTINAGQTWDTLHSGHSDVTLRSIRFCNSRTGYACGNGEVILKTTDAGGHWAMKPRIGATVGDLESVFCIDTNTTVVVGGSGYIFRTVNSGADWAFTSVANWLSALYFTSAKTGYVGGNYGSIYKTDDSGSTWTKVLDDAASNIWFNSLWFTDANTGYVAGGSKIFKTANAGVAWDSMPTGMSSGALYSLSFTSAHTGYAVGSVGTILKLSPSTASIPVVRDRPQVSPLTCKSDVLTCRTRQPGTLTICAMDGRLMMSRRIAGNGGKMELSDLPRGTYLATLRSSDAVTTLQLTR